MIIFMITVSHGGAIFAESPCDLEALFRAREPVWDASKIAELITPDGATLAWGSSGIIKSYVLMYEATDDTYYLDRFIQFADRLWEVRSDHAGIRDVLRDKMMPAWTSTRYSQGKPTVCMVHTGMITYPVARFVWLVKTRPELSRYMARAEEYLPWLQETVECHDDLWKDGPFSDEGEYGEVGIWPNSVNQTHSMVRPLLMLWLVTGEPKYLDKVERAARYFKRRLTWHPDGSVDWGHFMPDPLGRPPYDEDISHAGSTVDFAALCAQHGIVFTHKDMMGFVKTFREKVCKMDGDFSSTVSGRDWLQTWGLRAAVRWGRLFEYDPTIYDYVAPMACKEHSQPSKKIGVGVGIPYLLIAKNKHPWLVE